MREIIHAHFAPKTWPATSLTYSCSSIAVQPAVSYTHLDVYKRQLQHHAQRAAQVCLADLVDVDAVVANLAVGDVIEAVDVYKRQVKGCILRTEAGSGEKTAGFLNKYVTHKLTITKVVMGNQEMCIRDRYSTAVMGWLIQVEAA